MPGQGSSEIPVIDGFMSIEELQDPRPSLARARQETPIFKTTDRQDRTIYVVTHYDLVKECFSRPADFSNDFGFLIRSGSGNAEADRILAATGLDYEKDGTGLPNQDGAEHTRRRNLVQPACTAPAVKGRTKFLRVVGDQLIDEFIDRGVFEVGEDFAVSFAIMAKLDVLGLDKHDKNLVKKGDEWSKASLIRTGGLATAEEEIDAARKIVDFQQHMRAVVRGLNEVPRDDLMSSVVQQIKQEADPLTEDELVGLMLELFLAGNEASKTTIMAGMALMARHPDQWALLKANPALAGNAAVEVLRCHSTASSIFRIVPRNMQLGGIELLNDAIVSLRQDSANRDGQFFSDRTTFNISRERSRYHIIFGFGAHQCLGQALARRELVITLEKCRSASEICSSWRKRPIYDASAMRRSCPQESYAELYGSVRSFIGHGGGRGPDGDATHVRRISAART